MLSACLCCEMQPLFWDIAWLWPRPHLLQTDRDNRAPMRSMGLFSAKYPTIPNGKKRHCRSVSPIARESPNTFRTSVSPVLIPRSSVLLHSGATCLISVSPFLIPRLAVVLHSGAILLVGCCVILIPLTMKQQHRIVKGFIDPLIEVPWMNPVRTLRQEGSPPAAMHQQHP